MYSRVDQVKFLEDSLEKIWRDMVYLDSFNEKDRFPTKTGRVAQWDNKFTLNWKVSAANSNPPICSIKLWVPTSLRGYMWPSWQINQNEVIDESDWSSEATLTLFAKFGLGAAK